MTTDDFPIVSFDCIAPPRELCIAERAPDLHCGHDEDPQMFQIRMANSHMRREAASLLIRKMYGWRGYQVAPIAPQEVNRLTLVAEFGGATVGTMTLCLDTDALLPADETFGNELDALRLDGRRLCEPSRLAIDRGVSKRVFASLIHIAYIYAHNIHACTDWVIEVNPRHVLFYRRMLGFEPLGDERECERVGAPAVLLHLPLSYMGEQIRRFGGWMEQHGNERSFYPYCFSVHDEAGITGRLRRRDP